MSSDPADQAAEIRGYLAASISKRRLGVEYGYDVTWAPVQTPQGMLAVYTLLLSRGSPLLGQGPLFHLAQIPSPRPTAEMVDVQVADGMRQLAELFEQLKKPPAAPPAQAQAGMALANGRRP